MKTLKLIFAVFIALSMSACSNDFDDLALQSSEDNNPKLDYRLTNALNRAERLLSRMENRTRTDVRLVESVKFVDCGRTTRGESTDSLYYLVNYADNRGFAVLGATEETDGIYAISGEGHLEMEDTIDNPGLAMFFAGLPRTIPTRPGLGLDTTVTERPVLNYYEDLSTQLKPMLSVNVAKWHQRYPYNIECNANGTNYPAGCAPLAVAMIMTYYEWPQSYNSVKYDWQAIKSAAYYSDIIAAKIPTLIKEIGAKNNLNTSYKNDGSSTYTEDTYKRTFKNFGYKTPGNFKDYSLNELGRFLHDNKKPVLMKGQNLEKVGHLWVIDGYYYDWHWSNMVVGGYYGEGYLFHAVWGWGSSCNGYFKISDGFTPMTNFNGTDDDKSFTGSDYDQVQFRKLRYMGDLVPNK